MVSDEFFAPVDADEPAGDDEGFGRPPFAVDPAADFLGDTWGGDGLGLDSPRVLGIQSFEPVQW
jgi:hypothetical protein